MVRTHIVGALGAVGLLLLTGCSSGSTAATPTTSSTTSSAPSSSSSTVAPSSPTPKPTTAGDRNVPPAARAHTKAGAKAFVVAYLDAVNATGQRPRVGILEGLALDSCKSCNNFENQVIGLVKSHQHYAGQLGTFSVEEPRTYTSKSTSLYARLQQRSTLLLSSSGQVKQKLKAGSSIVDFRLDWITDRWKAAKIYDAG